MLNILPRQTWAIDEVSEKETSARIEAFAARKVSLSRRSAAVSSHARNGEAVVSAEEDAPLALPVTIERHLLGRLIALQEWEGYVTAIGDEAFEAELVDITARRRHETEKVSLLLSDLSEDDRRGLQEGTVFRWVIGYQRLPGGTRQRVSQLYFRRIAEWTSEQSSAIEAASSKLLAELGLA